MSNLQKDQPSIRVCAPPGGRTANIFGVPEPEAPVTTKKNYMQSDIFGCKQESQEVVPSKPARTMTNNIFGSDPEPVAPKSKAYSDKNRSTIFDEPAPQQPSNKPDRQRSNIFGTNEPVQPVQNRPVADKFKSNIFGSNDSDEQNKRQPGTRQGLRVGYNPINGEAYSTKEDVSAKIETLEISDDAEKPTEETNEEAEKNGQKSPAENGDTPATVVEQPQPTNGHAAGKPSHTSVRVFHPPGGKSNGPLW